jgi:nucleoside-diphosphate-sugar epimerase
VKPWEAYGTAKLEMEEDFINSNLPVQIIRPGTILGPGRKGGIVSLLKRAAEGNPVILPAGGQVVHPFVHVDDVVQAICQRAVKAKSESDTLITTLVAPHPHTISQTIETWTGRAPKVISLPHSIFNVIGSDYFPIHGISKWHAGALLYDFSGLEITGNNGQVPMLDTIGSVIGFDATA